MLKPRVIRMALAVDYINEYLMKKGVEFNGIADVCDKLISFEVIEKPIDEFKLDELAEEYKNKLVSRNGYDFLSARNKEYADLKNIYNLMIAMYKHGYRKAKEI